MGWIKPKRSNTGDSHEHLNLQVLDLFSIGEVGELLYDGQPIKGDLELPIVLTLFAQAPDGTLLYDGQPIETELPAILKLFTIDFDGNLLFGGQLIKDKRLDDLKITIDEINKLTGVKWNVQDQIDTNIQSIQSLTQRVKDTEDGINDIVTTDEKVKMNALGAASYLSELIDGLTIKDVNGKLTVEGLSGLLATINEINFLQGVNSNIQSQIDNLKGVSNFRGVFTSLEVLKKTPDPKPGEYAIVTNGESSSYYFYYENSWDYAHEASGVSSIDINGGTSGILSKTRYEKQNASETPFIDANGKILSKDTNSAIIEVFQYADSLRRELVNTIRKPLNINDSLDVTLQKIKQWYVDLVNAINYKGVNTSVLNNGDEVVQRIGSIPNITIEGVIKKKSKINVKAGSNIEVQLSSAMQLVDITSTLIEFIQGTTGLVQYNLAFNNGDSNNFEQNEYVEFDGTMKIKKNFDFEMQKDMSWTYEGNLFTYEIVKSDWLGINYIDVINKGV